MKIMLQAKLLIHCTEKLFKEKVLSKTARFFLAIRMDGYTEMEYQREKSIFIMH